MIASELVTTKHQKIECKLSKLFQAYKNYIIEMS